MLYKSEESQSNIANNMYRTRKSTYESPKDGIELELHGIDLISCEYPVNKTPNIAITRMTKEANYDVTMIGCKTSLCQ